ncbi:hypothetical protein [Arthrobacter sp. QXT-31]|uniref:hypothetical protein n=1 Tax=Arthrobacter sp. QXT-31 TaxID=1357915 RepID=UPI000971BA44|nr:hypothetical protein [Arthrobacter sp. QXT-31]APX00384.1 hypothetical protein BWQ92_00320 [Arthrobacter sp. QXT-31]
MSIEVAAALLAEHSTFTWNKARTRIRCNATDCDAVMDAHDGESGAAAAFPWHQSDLLPVSAEAILAEHSAYGWNKDGTRIRCNGCRTVMGADGGTGALLAFARHQAEQLPEAVAAEPLSEQETVPVDEPDIPEEVAGETEEEDEEASSVPTVRRNTKLLGETIAALK